MAVIGAIALGTFSIKKLGEPIAWLPFERFSPDTLGGHDVVHGYNFLMANGNPVITRANLDLGGYTAQFDLTATVQATSNWLDFAGSPVDTSGGTTPFPIIPNITAHRAYRGVKMADGKILIFFGDPPTNYNEAGLFDTVANTFTATPSMNHPNYAGTSYPALCLGENGTLYSFGGSTRANSHKWDGGAWTLLPANTATGGSYEVFAGGFAVPVGSNLIWCGGGQNSSIFKQLGTYLFNTATETWSQGPLLPDVGGIESQIMNLLCANFSSDGRVCIASKHWTRIYNPATNLLTELQVPAGNIHSLSNVELNTSNTAFSTQTMVSLSDGRLFLTTKSGNPDATQGSWISVHVEE